MSLSCKAYAIAQTWLSKVLFPMPCVERPKLMVTPESQLITHDISLPLDAGIDAKTGKALPTRQLRLLLLSRTSVSADKLDETLKRVRHFASLTGGQDLAIVFLLSAPPTGSFMSAKQVANGATAAGASDTDGVYAYTKLQAEMVGRNDVPYIPILPLASLESLPILLTKHVAAITRPRQLHATTKPIATSFELLQLCTAIPPMQQQTGYILSDLFSSLQELAEACTTVSSAPNSSSPSARAAAVAGLSQTDDMYGLSTRTNGMEDSAHGKLKRLRDLVGEQQCMDIVDFWRDEWTVD